MTKRRIFVIIKDSVPEGGTAGTGVVRGAGEIVLYGEKSMGEILDIKTFIIPMKLMKKTKIRLMRSRA